MQSQGDGNRLAGTAGCRAMGSQMPGDCDIKQFALDAAGWPSLRLRDTRLDHLQLVEVEVLSNSSEGQRIH